MRVLAVGGRQPKWVDDAVDRYASRLPSEWRFSVTSLPGIPRRKNRDSSAAVRDEGRALLAALRSRERLVALDERGTCHSSADLAARLNDWINAGQDLCFSIGGADGLSEEIFARAMERWSLSKLTLPHGLARVVAVEQLYRAWSMINGHPYHRA